MINEQTLRQILQVFAEFRRLRDTGLPVDGAYRAAVRAVASVNAITYQTLGDACRRRLGLRGVDETHALLGKWLEGDPDPLIRQLKKRAQPAAHPLIDAFFAHEGKAPSGSRDAGALPATMTVRLSPRDAKPLRALAALVGVPASELVTRMVVALMPVVRREIVRQTRDQAQDEATGVIGVIGDSLDAFIGRWTKEETDGFERFMKEQGTDGTAADRRL